MSAPVEPTAAFWRAEVIRLTASATADNAEELHAALTKAVDHGFKGEEFWVDGHRTWMGLYAKDATDWRHPDYPVPLRDWQFDALTGFRFRAASPPPRQPWRIGSCGESGPFIGLGHGWGCELSRRILHSPPSADPFKIKEEMLTELGTEPDLLKDFTEEEVIRGMAAYSWTQERTHKMLAELREKRSA
jgi:hypothetical protein